MSPSLADQVSICIKHTPQYASRRRKLSVLLRSIRAHFGRQLIVLVASELWPGRSPKQLLLNHLLLNHLQYQ